MRSHLRRYFFCLILITLTLAYMPLTGGTALAKDKREIPMDRTTLTEKALTTVFGDAPRPLAVEDPDLATMRDHLIYGEIAHHSSLDTRQRTLLTLAVLTTIGGLSDFDAHVKAGLDLGVKPVDMKETLYQCAPYIGFPKVEAALKVMNSVFANRNIKLPLESQATVNETTRYSEGLHVQKGIFGEVIDKMHATAPENQKELQKHLTAFCFGDVYTRKGLDLKMRELVTFSVISALGGCESQAKSHAQANIKVGNSKENLINALTLALPYMGFPRTLNALACVNEVVPES